MQQTAMAKCIHQNTASRIKDKSVYLPGMDFIYVLHLYLDFIYVFFLRLPAMDPTSMM